MSGSKRDGRLILGLIALALGGLDCVASACALVWVWQGLHGSYSETETGVMTGVCIGLTALVLSFPALVVGALAFRRPHVAPASTMAAVAGIVAASFGAIAALSLLAFAFLAAVVNTAAVVH